MAYTCEQVDFLKMNLTLRRQSHPPGSKHGAISERPTWNQVWVKFLEWKNKGKCGLPRESFL